ncbi:hypothetical protein ACQPZF_12160 [Actinosynnema sp. CS-041913]|uniref:hypothetical protein n=1 Tax=Actinosynnema sp. CS-041913 TaxID=3239917 RepID=UPI003D8D57A9
MCGQPGDRVDTDTDYYIRVRAVERLGLYARATYPVKIRTKPQSTTHRYALTGTAKVKGASVPLTGTLDTTIGSRTHTSVLTLQPTDVTLNNRPPVTAHLRFLPDGNPEGTLADGVFTTTARVAFAIPRVTLHGHEVSLPASCRTTPAEIPLTSGPGFDPRLGGALSGTFTMPPLSGCGQFTSLVNSLLAGGGNTVAVNLAPRG